MTVASPCTQHLMDSAHPQTVLSKLNEQRSQGLFCDVTIVVEDVKFRAHKNILAASSGYFKNALTAPETLNSGQVLELMDLKSEVFASILNFIYCSKVTSCGAGDSDSLMAAGKRLGIPFLEKFAEQDTQHIQNDSVRPTDSSKVLVPKITKKELPRPDDLDRGPRITNAFSMTEVCPGNNPFTPLGQPSGERQSPDVRQLPSRCPATSSFSVSNETTHALSEHSYAVSHTADAADNSQRDKKLCKPSISQSKQLMYRNSGPLKKRHRLRGTLGKSILPTPVDSHTDNVSATAQTLDSGGTVAPAAVLTPPPLISVANTDKTFDSGPPMDVDEASNELGPPTLSPQTEESISVFSCNHCPELFTSQALLAVHKTIHKKRFVGHLLCKFCRRKFIHLKRLRNHEQVCSKAVRGPPKHITQTMPPEVESSVENQSNEENVMSELPSTGLSTTDAPELDRTDLPGPLKTVKTIMPSANQRRYNCSVCKRVYVTLSSLKRHENVHSWQRAYPCHYCNKVFALAEYRTKHEIWHTGERRYQCIFCLETFMTYYILKNHQKSFHGIDPSLAVKKKSANGGLKASVYPIKLYRLLPMKFRKTRYKTYSNTYTAASEAGELGAQDNNTFLPSFEENPHNAALPLTFMVTTKTMAPIVPHITIDKPCDQGIGQSNESEMQTNTENNTPFLSYASTLPLQSDRETYADPSSLLISSLNNVKKLSELSASAKRVEDMTKELLESGPGDLLHNRNELTETYIAKPACLGPSANGDPLPLCQITVKIGNEAIIRRRIKGSKLFPRKKRKINEFGQMEKSSLDTSPRLRLREDAPAMEEDANDMPWRPYYSYKTKKKKKKIKFSKHMYSGLIEPEGGKCSRESEECSSTGNGELKRSLLRYNCDICDSSFITENGLRAHIIGSHPCFCRTCGKQGPPGEVPAGGDYVCKKCMENGSCFDSQPRSPGMEKKYRCSFCPQRFLYLATKKSHEKKHQNSSNDSEFQFEGFSPKCSANQSEETKQDLIKAEDSDNVVIKSEEENYLIDKPKSEDTDFMSTYEDDHYSDDKSPPSPCLEPQFSQTTPIIKHKKRLEESYSKDSRHLTPKKKFKSHDGTKDIWSELNNGFKKSKKLLWRGESKDAASSKHRPEKWVCKEEPISKDI